ncbi:MAG: type II pantothenate kinase [Sporolactobacillus sp.]
MSKASMIGIDAGGTLTKLAIQDGEKLLFRQFASSSSAEAAAWLGKQFPDAALCLTGGRAKRLANELHRPALPVIAEFEAMLKGSRYLLSQGSVSEPSDYILTNVGTGTSIHRIKGNRAVSLNGSGVGGGTLVGLCRLIMGVQNFDEIVRLAAAGHRDRVDLTVGRLYEGSEPPLPSAFTASNFGYVTESQEMTTADQAAAAIGLVAETITTLSIFAAQKEQLQTIVYIGSTFSGNPLMKQIVRDYSRYCSMQPVFPAHGAFSGAIGAMLHLARKKDKTI